MKINSTTSIHASSLSHQPIGIFDSGVGGLTVAHALTTLLPEEKIIYFGDVAHHPYGEKSQAAIQAYTVKICDFLLSRQVKLILIACHSASSAAYDLAKAYVGSRTKVVNVIDPTLDFIRENFNHHTIGLIGTRHTVNSQIYQQKINQINHALKLKLQLQSLAAPLLVQIIEEGYADSEALQTILADYLLNPVLKNIDALILGCTHYPIIKTQIARFYAAHKNFKHKNIQLIDSAHISAIAVKGLLEHHCLLNTPSEKKTRKTKKALTASQTSSHQFYVSDYTQAFVNSARFFFPQSVHFESYPLWE